MHLYRDTIGRLFPRGVRVWHFVLIPPLGMALLLAGFRLLDGFLIPQLQGAAATELYQMLRTILIGLAMALIITVLAVEYRSGYERKLRARNVELEAARDFLSRIIEGTADAIVVRDAAGAVTSWNPAAEAIFGWTVEEMRGRSLERLLAPGDGPASELPRIEATLRAGGTVRDLEVRGVRKDGAPITLSLTVAPLYDASGGFAGSTGILRDVTEIERLQRQLLERERLAAVGEMAAVVAHEVRNPLAGIRGGCEILLEPYAEGDDRHAIGVEVLHQVDRLSRTVHDLLLFARPKAATLEPTDLHALIERTLRVLRDDQDNGGVAFVREFGEEVAIVRADGRQLEQVFLNLFLNAAQIMDRRGTVTIATRREGTEVVVDVTDTGPGIPPDRIGRIFDPFYTTRAQGTGLGLAIVKKIVEAHGGRIEAASPPGSGARFTVRLAAGGGL